MQINKLEASVLHAGERQSDSFLHEPTAAIRYLLVLHGVARSVGPNLPPEIFNQRAGHVTSFTDVYAFLALHASESLPGSQGPITVAIIL
ncbi:MAG: hypothetical protein P4L46_26040 [Fimbriimonas sp.]|nr:hypothetical protein [Fimbriimonas sp.]